jgi:RNA polymerase sigma-70 factor (ECF subfamily)
MNLSNKNRISIKSRTLNKDVSVEIFFEEYFTPLALFSKTYTNDIEISKDIVQDIFCTLLENQTLFSSINNFKAYLYNAVKNKSLNYLRHDQVKTNFIKYKAEKNNEKDDSFWSKVIEEEVYSQLMKAINKLPSQCKKVYLLLLEGKGNEEIANILDLNIETVKSHKKNGKRILASRLKGLMTVLELIMIGI